MAEAVLLSGSYPAMGFAVGVVLNSISVFDLWSLCVVLLSVQLGCSSSTRCLVWQSCKATPSPSELLEIASFYIIDHAMEGSTLFLLLQVKEHKDVSLCIRCTPLQVTVS